MNGDKDAGTAPCFLQDLDDAGNLLDPCHRIRLVRSREDLNPALTPVFLENCGNEMCVPELAPAPGEDIHAYASRLDHPLERTACWRVALLSEQGPVGVVVSDVPDAHAGVLLGRLRSLLA